MISDEQYLQFSPYFAFEDIEKEEDRLKFFRLLGTLPQTVKTLITSENTVEKALDISKRFGLDEFDAEALSFVIRKLATGEVSIVQGTDLITTEVGLPQEKAGDLLNLIIGEILAPVMGNTPETQFMRPPQKTITPAPENLSQPEPKITDPRVIDLRNR